MTGFNFIVFKSVMDVSDIDETTYAFILKSVFSYTKRVFNLDFGNTISLTAETGSTESVIKTTSVTGLQVGQVVTSGTEETTITAIDATNLTVTVSTAFTLVPTSITVYTQIPYEDLQYAVFMHAKFLFEYQKKNAQIIDSVTDTAGNKVSYKVKPPETVLSVYLEYSPNPIVL